VPVACVPAAELELFQAPVACVPAAALVLFQVPVAYVLAAELVLFQGPALEFFREPAAYQSELFRVREASDLHHPAV
jgi:hypothetical protein